MRTRLSPPMTVCDELEAARRELAHHRPEALLLVQLLIEEEAGEGALRMRRLAGQLRLCADIPELAEGMGYPPDTLDPGLMRAAAALLSQAACGPWA
jgi:hypothetical protein